MTDDYKPTNREKVLCGDDKWDFCKCDRYVLEKPGDQCPYCGECWNFTRRAKISDKKRMG